MNQKTTWVLLLILAAVVTVLFLLIALGSVTLFRIPVLLQSQAQVTVGPETVPAI